MDTERLEIKVGLQPDTYRREAQLDLARLMRPMYPGLPCECRDDFTIVFYGNGIRMPDEEYLQLLFDTVIANLPPIWTGRIDLAPGMVPGHTYRLK